MKELQNASAKALVGHLERIESLEVEKAQVSEKIKEEYAAAAASGFDKKALKAMGII